MRFKLVSAAIVAFSLAGCGGNDVAPSSSEGTPSVSPSGPETSFQTEYVASGNEPFWNIATFADRIVYSSPEKLDGETVSASASQADGWTRFEAVLEGQPVVLAVRKVPCSDDMSGLPFSHEARLTRGESTFNGCGRLASEPQPAE